MASYQTRTVLSRSFPSGSDCSGNQYKFVKFDANGAIVPFAAATSDVPAGVQLNAPAAATGSHVEVGMIGVFPVECGAALDEGALIQGADDAQAIAAASSGYVAGCVLDTPGADGSIVSCAINCVNPWLKA